LGHRSIQHTTRDAQLSAASRSRSSGDNDRAALEVRREHFSAIAWVIAVLQKALECKPAGSMATDEIPF
jgi:hypothetical protein